MAGTRRQYRRWVAALAAALLVAPWSTALAGATSPSVQRLAGANRFATAAAVAQHAFADGAVTVFVATGATFADAVAVITSTLGQAPLLLVTRDTVPEETVAELKRLAPQNIVLVGGTDAISEDVEVRLAALSGYRTLRYAGHERTETAAVLSRSSHPAGASTVYVASAYAFADALAATTSAAAVQAPLLLTAPTELSPATRAEVERLAPQKVVVVGGPDHVGDNVLTELSGLVGGNVERVAADDDPAISTALSQSTFTSADTAFVATSDSYADALSGGAVAAGGPSPLLLVSGEHLTDPVACELLRLGTTQVVVVGGEKAVPAGVTDELDQLMADHQWSGCPEA